VNVNDRFHSLPHNSNSSDNEIVNVKGSENASGIGTGNETEQENNRLWRLSVPNSRQLNPCQRPVILLRNPLQAQLALLLGLHLSNLCKLRRNSLQRRRKRQL
jgi:hypothetical protein